MILGIFTLFHVLISLVGIASGYVVVYGMLNSKRLDGWNKLFLITTAATSLTGFLFPVQHFMPSHAVGILSLLILGIAIPARYVFHMDGGRRRTYVITSIAALYFNNFVLVAQLFQKVPALKAMAPTGSEPPFAIAQLVVLTIFVVLGVLATKRSRTEMRTA